MKNPTTNKSKLQKQVNAAARREKKANHKIDAVSTRVERARNALTVAELQHKPEKKKAELRAKYRELEIKLGEAYADHGILQAQTEGLSADLWDIEKDYDEVTRDLCR